MAKDLALTFNLKFDIEEDLAETCLKIIQTYCNNHGKSIRTCPKQDGCIELTFVDPTPQR